MFKNFYLNINNRPISPHLLIYSPQLSSLFSIWHRITGVLLASSITISLLIVKTFTITSFYHSLVFKNMFFFIYQISWISNYFYLSILLFLVYHILNGIRHIIWDIGLFLNIKSLLISSSIFLVILSLILGFNIIEIF